MQKTRSGRKCSLSSPFQKNEETISRILAEARAVAVRQTNQYNHDEWTKTTSPTTFWPNDLWTPVVICSDWELSLRRTAQLHLLIAGATDTQMEAVRALTTPQIIATFDNLPGLDLAIVKHLPLPHLYAMEWLTQQEWKAPNPEVAATFAQGQSLLRASADYSD